jgi:hypothetical protein
MTTLSTEKKSVEADVAGVYWESRVSEALGVPRKLIAQLRGNHLTLGEDFVRRENNAVALTAAGLAKLESLLATPANAERAEGGLPAWKPPANPVPPADIPPGPPEARLMIVQHVPFHRSKLLMCIPDERTEIVTVRVRDNANFKVGLRIEAMKAADGYWQFRNREGGNPSTIGRLPRMPGKW